MEENNLKPYLLAVDPGRDKIGLAVLTQNGIVIEKSVVAAPDFADNIAMYMGQHHPEIYAVGDSTQSKFVFDILSAVVASEVLKISEKGSTLEARELAWSQNPPHGFFRALPKIFWPTPPDVDAWAAVIIGRRALSKIKK